MSREQIALNVLAALGHAPTVSTKCTASVKHTPTPGRPFGPSDPPIFCCLQAGHEGRHMCNFGGMSRAVPFRDSEVVEFREPLTLCANCRTPWPCGDARAALAAVEKGSIQ